jgi:hypothetical protein
VDTLSASSHSATLKHPHDMAQMGLQLLVTSLKGILSGQLPLGKE